MPNASHRQHVHGEHHVGPGYSRKPCKLLFLSNVVSAWWLCHSTCHFIRLSAERPRGYRSLINKTNTLYQDPHSQEQTSKVQDGTVHIFSSASCWPSGFFCRQPCRGVRCFSSKFLTSSLYTWLTYSSSLMHSYDHLSSTYQAHGGHGCPGCLWCTPYTIVVAQNMSRSFFRTTVRSL